MTRSVPGYPRRVKAFPDSAGCLLVVDEADGVELIVGVPEEKPAVRQGTLPFGVAP